MTTVDDHGRVEPPLTGGETDTLLGYLDYQRSTLAWKTDGLDAAGLSATVGASTMTLGGLLKHMAFVEDHWFTYMLHAQERQPPWNSAESTADPDWEWHSAARDTPGELRNLWEAAVQRSRSLTTEALGGGELGQVARRPWPNGGAPSLRWILVHMIEEYARHNGHADLLRESVDGSTGE